MPNQNDEGSEQRKFKRIDQHFMAKLQADFEDEEAWHTIFLRDLGAGGVLFNHSSELQAGSQIRLSIVFPASKTPLVCTALVIRTRTLVLPLKAYEIAAVFTDIDEDQKELIDRAADLYFSKKRRNSG